VLEATSGNSNPCAPPGRLRIGHIFRRAERYALDAKTTGSRRSTSRDGAPPSWRRGAAVSAAREDHSSAVDGALKSRHSMTLVSTARGQDGRAPPPRRRRSMVVDMHKSRAAVRDVTTPQAGLRRSISLRCCLRPALDSSAPRSARISPCVACSSARRRLAGCYDQRARNEHHRRSRGRVLGEALRHRRPAARHGDATRKPTGADRRCLVERANSWFPPWFCARACVRRALMSGARACTIAGLARARAGLLLAEGCPRQRRTA
jgi:hypothetical protein